MELGRLYNFTCPVTPRVKFYVRFILDIVNGDYLEKCNVKSNNVFILLYLNYPRNGGLTSTESIAGYGHYRPLSFFFFFPVFVNIHTQHSWCQPHLALTTSRQLIPETKVSKS